MPHEQPVTATTVPNRHPYILPWLCPAPHRVDEREGPQAADGFRVDVRGLGEENARRLRDQAVDLGIAVEQGLPLCVILGEEGPEAAPIPLPEEFEALRGRPGAYWIELTETSCTVRAESYEGAVHAMVRLAQWRRLPAGERRAFRMLDFPRLAFRGMNRDDEEDWSLDYWQRTIRYSRNLFLNRLALSAEQAFLARARGDAKRYDDLVRRFHAIRDEGAAAGIDVMPMFYNVDHMLGQFLKAAGREDLCRMANRIIIRYDSPEAWEAALDLCTAVLSDLAPRSFAIWASETSHEDQGVEGIAAADQYAAESAFCANLVRRVRERAGEAALVMMLSQGTREWSDLFTRACRGLPVEFVHYDGEWTYCMPCPLPLPPAMVRRSIDDRGDDTMVVETPPLTTWQVAESLERGVPWIGKPAWIRIAYQGLPYLRPAAIVRECRELVEKGYRGIFPNASRWESNPWNVSLGAAAAWDAGRLATGDALRRFFAPELDSVFTADDIRTLETIWIRMTSMNTPMEAAPRLSAFRSTLFHMALFVERACGDPAFAVSDFEEIYFVHAWQREAGWLRESMQQVERWKGCLDGADREEISLWTHSVRILEPLLALHAHLLAAAFVVCREYSPDNSKGPWKAWRRLLAWHMERAQEAMDGVLAFQPLDTYIDRAQNADATAFDQPSELPLLYRFETALREMRTACGNVLERIEDASAFSALKTRKGLDGAWPRGGLYECLGWPVRKQ
jgi:hypothetical protein